MALPNPLVAPLTDNELSYASGCLLSPTPQVSRPRATASSRLRRSNGSSNDESPVAESDGFLEADLRAGGPILCDSPCDTIPYTEKDARYRDALAHIGGHQGIVKLLDICREANLEALEIGFCGRRSVFTPRDDPTFTLLVVARRVGDGGWIRIARRLYDHLRAEGVTNASVEINDLRFQRRPHFVPCQPNDALFSVWERVAKEIVRSISISGIYTINCVRIGENESTTTFPTILVGVDSRVQRHWNDTRDRICAILDKWELETVGVMIRKDVDPSRCGIRGRLVQPPRVEVCTDGTRPGFSFAPNAPIQGFGTFGGWVELLDHQTNTWLPFGLTCAHCCFTLQDDT